MFFLMKKKHFEPITMADTDKSEDLLKKSKTETEAIETINRNSPRKMML